MKQPNDATRLRHMLESAKEATEFLGLSAFEDLRDNRMLAYAIVRALEVVGEAASQVTQTYKSKRPEIEWKVIVGMRNRLVHAYFDIDYWVVWQTVRQDLPPLIKQLTKIFSEEEPQPEE